MLLILWQNEKIRTFCQQKVRINMAEKVGFEPT